MTHPPDHAAAKCLAEEATLGALLTNPTAIAAVSRWLRAADFADPWHAAVYTVLREQHTARAPITPQGVVAGLVERLGARRANAPRVADLLHAAPTRPDPARYAQMVAESGLRREVAAQGVLLRAGALRSVLSGTGHPTAAACGLVDATLTSVGRRWAMASGAPAPVDTVRAPLRAAARSTEVRLGADKLLRLHPPRDVGTERVHEAALVAALVAHPAAIPAVAAWLPPTRLTDPAWRTVYAAAVDLAELGEHVDAITVTWAMRRPAHHGAPTPDLSVLSGAVDGARFVPPAVAVRAVAGDQLRRLADIAATQLTTAAANPGVLVADLADTGRVLTGALRQVASVITADASATPTAVAEVRELLADRGPVAG